MSPLLESSAAASMPGTAAILVCRLVQARVLVRPAATAARRLGGLAARPRAGGQVRLASPFGAAWPAMSGGWYRILWLGYVEIAVNQLATKWSHIALAPGHSDCG